MSGTALAERPVRTAPHRTSHASWLETLAAEYAPDMLAPPDAPSTSRVEDRERYRSVDLDDFIEQSKIAPAWLVPDLIPSGAIAIFSGEPRSFKTTGALQLAFAVASEHAWLDRRPAVTGGALYITQEGAKYFLGAQLGAFRKMMGRKHAFRVSYMLGIRPTNATAWDMVQEEVGKQKVVLVIVDTLAKTMDGDENKAEDMNAYLDPLHRLCGDTGTTVILIHHVNKGGTGRDTSRVRGSSALPAASDAVLTFKRASDTTGLLDRGTIYAESKYSPPEHLDFAFEPEKGLYVPEASRLGWATDVTITAAVRKEYEATGQPVPFQRLLDLFPGWTKTPFKQKLADVAQRGLIQRVGKTRDTGYCPAQPSLDLDQADGDNE